MHVKAEHTEQWLRGGKAALIPDAIASQLGACLNGLPWPRSFLLLDMRPCLRSGWQAIELHRTTAKRSSK